MAWTAETRAKALETKRRRGLFNQYDKAKLDGVQLISKLKGRPGKSIPHSEETKLKLREKALSSNHRRLLKSTRTYATRSGEQVLLDSSWEEALARRLDELSVEWVRPKEPLNWIDKRGYNRNYFPDFFLPEFDIYLDPKNPAAMKAQKEKVDWLRQNESKVVFLKSIEECKTYVPVAQRIVAAAF